MRQTYHLHFQAQRFAGVNITSKYNSIKPTQASLFKMHQKLMEVVSNRSPRVSNKNNAWMKIIGNEGVGVKKLAKS